MKRMRIAFWNTGFFPGEKYGGPVASIYNLTELLGDDLDIYVICANHDLGETTIYPNIEDGWNKVGKAKVRYLSDSYFQKNCFEQIIKEIRPQVICVSSIFSAVYTYPVLTLAIKYNIPLLLAPRGELLTSALRIKWLKKRIYLLALKWKKILRGIYYHATSEREKQEICKNMSVDEKRVILLPNVPAIFKERRKISKKKGFVKVCFSGRIIKNKNLLIAIKAVMAARSTVLFDIFGAIEDPGYWDQCNELITTLPNNIRINYWGNISPVEMLKKYEDYHCLISPTEFENYGHSLVEAMVHEVPVIVSKGRTPWDDIEEMGAGFIAPLTDIDAFTKAIDIIGQMDDIMYNKMIARLRKYSTRKFDFTSIRSKYIDTFSKLIHENEAGCNYVM